MLDGKSPQSHRISGLWWLMFSMAVVVYILVITLVLVAAFRRNTAGYDAVAPADETRSDHRLLLYGGLALPMVVLSVIAVQTVRVSNSLQAATATVHVTVDAEDWWWRVSYPADDVVTANEIHVPVGQRVQIALRSDNVIHSLWVPQLNGKSDVIPGETNFMTFTAESTGTYRGQCAEFCGIEHAKMAFVVVVESDADYVAWLAANRHAAVQPQTALQREGAQILATTSCAGCHTVAGTAATGIIGPDLTHVGSRSTLAADTLPNTDAGMTEWLSATQRVKQGALMPQIDLSSAQVAALVAYLESLK